MFQMGCLWSNGLAKQPPSKSGTSRIRFIMLDAEIPEGDLSQITAAIQNALKPQTTIVQQRIPTGSTGQIISGRGGDDVLDAVASDMDEVEVEVEEAQPETHRASREPKAARKPTVPKVLDIDITSGTSFEAFASEHPPKTDVDRNLVVLAWFKENRPDEAVTPNHVYTCYRAMKWPSGIEDFGGPLRYLKKQQLVKGIGQGQYEINHLGIAKVDDLRSTG